MAQHPIAKLSPCQYYTLDDNDSLVRLTTSHESLIRFPSFDYTTAWEVGSAIRSHFLDEHPDANQAGGPGLVIGIELFNGNTLFRSLVGHGPAVGPGNWYVHVFIHL